MGVPQAQATPRPRHTARVVKRAACLLRSAAGDRAKDIARVLGLSVDAVTDIRRRWRRRRMRSVQDRPRSGRPPRATAAYLRELRRAMRAMRAGPLRCGYVFTVWSVKRLGAYLKRRTGVRLGRGAAAPAAGRGVRRAAARPHPAGQAGRGGVRASAAAAGAAKGALEPGCSYELWYADATESTCCRTSAAKRARRGRTFGKT